MTTRELIEKLKQFDPDLEVVLITEERISPCLSAELSYDARKVLITDESDD